MMPFEDIAKQYGPENALMISLCRIFAGTESVEELTMFISSNNIDWLPVFRTARMQQLRPVIFQSLSNAGFIENTQQQLKEPCRTIAFENIEKLKELSRIYGLLKKADINAIPYKGGVFAMKYYGGHALREYGDIDFLIQLQDLEAIKGIMREAGYTDPFDIPEVFKTTHLKQTCEYFFDRYENGNRKFHVEFHWSLLHPIFDTSYSIPLELMFSEQGEEIIAGIPIRTLNETAHFIAMISHHGIKETWSSLKFVMDIAMFIKNEKNADWNKINELSHQYHFAKALRMGFELCSELLGIDTPVTILAPKDCSPYIQRIFSNSGSKNNILNSMMQKVKIKDGAGDKFALVLQYARYSFRPSVLDYKFLSLPKILYPFYFFVKPIRALLNSIQKK